MNKNILSIDAGTTGITILLLNDNLQIIDRSYSEFNQIYPQPGWVEHDPEEIWNVTLGLLKEIIGNNPTNQISCIGITNQRETTIIWDRVTYKPIYNAIVWQDRRTKSICNELQENNLSELFSQKTGLVLDSYFSGTKIKWILDNVHNAREDANNNKLLFGTVDTWLLWKLTNGDSHKTDFTNASRTLIYNINDKCWDDELLHQLNIPKSILPEVCNSSDEFGMTDKNITGYTIPITGISGDQQSALYGQCGFNSGEMKTTYGTGCFMLVNTGNNRINSTSGFLTTLACNFRGEPVYALEGSVFIGGAVMQWLRDELQIILNASESEEIAFSIPDTGGVYIVPAFVGLGAPYWNMEARGTITGLTRGSGRAQIIRAALESIAYQVSDLFTSIAVDLQDTIDEMKVDGGAAENNFLMQFQSNLLNIPVIRPKNIESTALGAAMLAGRKAGIWQSPEELLQFNKPDTIFSPKMDNKIRESYLNGWKTAINQTLSIN